MALIAGALSAENIYTTDIGPPYTLKSIKKQTDTRRVIRLPYFRQHMADAAVPKAAKQTGTIVPQIDWQNNIDSLTKKSLNLTTEEFQTFTKIRELYSTELSEALLLSDQHKLSALNKATLNKHSSLAETFSPSQLKIIHLVDRIKAYPLKRTDIYLSASLLKTSQEQKTQLEAAHRRYIGADHHKNPYELRVSLLENRIREILNEEQFLLAMEINQLLNTIKFKKLDDMGLLHPAAPPFANSN